MIRFKITIRPDAGASRSNGKPVPVVASRGRVFFVYAITLEHARDRFRSEPLPSYGNVPAVPQLFDDDFDVAVSTAEDEKTKTIENWMKARP